MMTPAEFRDRMRDIFPLIGYDKEAAHGEADSLMCDLLRQLDYDDGIDIFEHADKWYA